MHRHMYKMRGDVTDSTVTKVCVESWTIETEKIIGWWFEGGRGQGKHTKKALPNDHQTSTVTCRHLIYKVHIGH